MREGYGSRRVYVCVSVKVAVQACDHETTRAYLIQTRSTDGNKLYIK